MESAAIPAAVAGKNQGELSLQYFSVQCDAVGPVDALDDVGQSGKPIGAGACDQGEVLIPGGLCANAGIQAHGADI